MFEELERCILDGITEDELERTRHAVLADFLFGAETVDGVAHDAAWYSSYLGSPEMREVYRQRLNDVSAADVQRVANAYLHPKVRTLVLSPRPVVRPRSGPDPSRSVAGSDYPSSTDACH